MKLTIKDIANLSGVSKSTVSRVINKKKYVSKNSKERVLNIINELGYIPDGVARSLKTKETYTIGLIIPDIINPFYSETAKIIEKNLRKLGYSLIICNTENRHDLQNRYIDILKQKNVDGIIFGSVRINDSNINNLLAQGLPYITYHRKIGDKNSNYVISDDITGIKTAVKHLVDLGHKNIAYISGPTEFSTGSNRLKGFIEARNIFNLNKNNELIKEGGYSEYQSWQVTKEIINLDPRPSAIIAANDLMAISALDCVLYHGLFVPKDISLIGYDNINLASHARIQLTTISVDKKNMAKETANSLIKKIINKKSDSKLIQIMLNTKLIIRKTTAQKRCN
jgi:LacI family transcriptional regulator